MVTGAVSDKEDEDEDESAGKSTGTALCSIRAFC